MSREIENITNSFRKARKEGERMLAQERITWEDYCACMLGFEESLRNAGAEL